MKCKGCGKELDGAMAHSTHDCPTPSIAPMQDEGELIIQGNWFFHKAVEDAIKVHRDGFRFKE